jgi:hypothetical protein
MATDLPINKNSGYRGDFFKSRELSSNTRKEAVDIGLFLDS